MQIRLWLILRTHRGRTKNPAVPPARRSAAADHAYAIARVCLLPADDAIWMHDVRQDDETTRDALERFCDAPPSPLEIRERLEQLRALEMGMSIWAAVIDEAPISVDNPADLEKARQYARDHA